MAEDVASLVIRVQSLEAEVAQRRLKGLSGQGARAERATDGLTNSFKRLAGPLAGLISLSAGLNKLFETTKKFQNLDVQLKTATGSAEGAGVALDLIREFAEETKQPVDDVAQAFVKLKNLGLDPGERALLSYGNTAAAMGKDLDQLIEAVADAATGEFERLKEFGIKSSVEGDRVRFTFQGMTTEVGKSAAEIEGYLQSLGENQFAGALSEKAQTLEGSLNSLQNTWDELFQLVSEGGADEFMAEAFNTANDALQRFVLSIKSGEFEKLIGALGGKFDGFAEDVINGFSVLEDLFREEFQFFQDTGVSAVDLVGEAFLNMPENIRAMIQIAATELAYFVDRVGIFASEIAHDMNPKNWFGDSSEFDAQIQARIDAANSARQSSIDYILREREAKVESFNSEVEGANAAAEAYKNLNASKKGGSLSDFGGGGGDDGDGEGGDSSDSDKFAEQMELLRASLEIENATYAEAYSRRQELLVSMLTNGKIEEQKFQKESLKNTLKFLKAKEAEEKANADKRTAIMQGYYQSGLTLATAAFGKDKQFSKAVGAVKSIEAAMSAYAHGNKLGGPVLGASMAAAALAAQKQSQSKMDGVSLGSASVGGGYGGSVPQIPPEITQEDILQNSGTINNEPQGQQAINFIFNGPVNQAESLISMLQEAINEQDFVIADANSRQGQILRGEA